MTDGSRGLLAWLGVGLAVACAVCFARGVGQAANAAEAMAYVCDGFFASAVLLCGIAALNWARNEGLFDGLSYSVKQIIALRWPRLGGDYTESYGDYRQRKRKERRAPSDMLRAGICCAGACVITLIVYLCMGG